MSTTYSVHAHSFLSNTGNISDQTLFTPTESGLYRISVYYEAANESGGSPSFTLSYTDAIGSQSAHMDTLSSPVSISAGESHSLFADMVSDNAVAFSVTLGAGDPGSITYNLYFVIEKLG